MIEPALERLKRIASEGRAAAHPKDLYQWDAFDAAIEATVKRLPTLETLGEDGLRSVLRMWLAPAPVEARVAHIRSASMTELTAGNVRDAWELDQDTERRAAIRKEVVDYLVDLGIVGARLLLAVAFV